MGCQKTNLFFMTRHVETDFSASVGVFSGSPGVLQTAKLWGAIIEDVQHLGPQVRREPENIQNDTSECSFTLSEVFIGGKAPGVIFSPFMSDTSCVGMLQFSVFRVGKGCSKVTKVMLQSITYKGDRG